MTKHLEAQKPSKCPLQEPNLEQGISESHLDAVPKVNTNLTNSSMIGLFSPKGTVCGE